MHTASDSVAGLSIISAGVRSVSHDQRTPIMKHDQFRIGLEFYTATGVWRCTDVGTRVVAAMKLGIPDAAVYDGPPYAVPEFVFDEDDQAVATLRPQKLVVTGTIESRAHAAKRAATAHDAQRREVNLLRRVCGEAYHFAAIVGAPPRVLDNLWAAAEGKPIPHESFLPVTLDECTRDEQT